jgi:hypothetical protein
VARAFPSPAEPPVTSTTLSSHGIDAMTFPKGGEVKENGRLANEPAVRLVR